MLFGYSLLWSLTSTTYKKRNPCGSLSLIIVVDKFTFLFHKMNKYFYQMCCVYQLYNFKENFLVASRVNTIIILLNQICQHLIWHYCKTITTCTRAGIDSALSTVLSTEHFSLTVDKHASLSTVKTKTIWGKTICVRKVVIIK